MIGWLVGVAIHHHLPNAAGETVKRHTIQFSLISCQTQIVSGARMSQPQTGGWILISAWFAPASDHSLDADLTAWCLEHDVHSHEKPDDAASLKFFKLPFPG